MASILIVDDQQANREYLTELLSYGGHKLFEAGDGAEALTIAKTERPDLIIADILMPTMDGYELVRRLRADPPIAPTPVIFWTAHYHEREARALAESCGVSSVITKPTEPEAVLAAVENALGGVSTGGAAKPVPDAAAAAPLAAEAFDREHLRLLTDHLSQQADAFRTTNDRLSAMVELSTKLASELDPHRLIDSFAHAVRQIVGGRYAIAGILENGGTSFQPLHTSGMSAEAAAALRAPDPAVAPLRTLLQEGQIVRLYNPAGDAAALGLPDSHPPVHSWLGAPIASPTRAYGYIALIDKLGAGEFSAEDERLTGTLGAQVGRIYQNGTLYSEAMRHAADLEREMAARAETERALAEREEHIRLLLDSTAEAIFGVDMEGRCTFANAACARLLGCPDPRDLVGIDMHSMFHHTRKDGASYPMEDCRIVQAYRRNEPTHVDDEILWRADGTSFPAEYWSYPVVRGGEVVGAMVTFLDLTERRRLEKQFRRAQRRLREVVVSSPTVLFTLSVTPDCIGPISWVSDNLPAVLGYPPEAALDPAWWYANVHEEDRERAAAEANLELLGRGQCTHEFRFRHGDGNYRWARSDMRLIRDEAGRPVEVVGAWSDVSERKRAEEEQHKLREQLLQAQKLESVGRLAGGVAHDFNNLLTVINGYSDLLMRELTSNRGLHEMAAEIGIAGQRAAELTRQLLLLSRKQMIQTSEVNLNDVIAEVRKMLARVIGEDIRLEADLSPTLGRIMADPSQMHQVLMNLAVNARDAMPEGGRLLIETRNIDLEESFVEQHAEVKPGPYVELKVSDTGIGMSKDTLAHLFEPFFTTKNVGEGTGLGLATVYGIVKQALGSISVYSEPGQGTCFKIYLPRIEHGNAAPQEPQRSIETLRGTETILVVEDQEQLLKIAGSVLRSCGYHVLEAPNPSLALVESENYGGEIHLLLTDVVMPQMTGIELARRLQATRPAMRAVFMSGYSERVVADRRELPGPYLAKPFSPQALAEKVREGLQGPRFTGAILVADDEPGIRKLLRSLLGGAGYRVIEAENGKEAMRQMETADIDLVITDLAMPEQEGFETMTALRHARPHIKIIAMSGRFAGPVLRSAEYFGAQASIAKPIKADELLATVARVMG